MSNQQYDPHAHEPLPEGEEKAPRFTSTMALVRWAILGGMTLFALVMVLGYFGLVPWSTQTTDSVQYHCPMHPTYVSNQPGECPICGMSLVPVNSEGGDSTSEPAATPPEDALPGAEGAVAYTCPMHPEVVSHQPGRCPTCGMNLEQPRFTCPMHPEVVSHQPGRCPKCGMNLEPAAPPAEHAQYTCPMHPEVVSDQPDRCPKCGMDLVLKPDSQPTSNSPAPGHGESAQTVPGLVAVTLEPQRLQLAGVRTGTVALRPLAGSLRLLGFVTPDETRLADIHVRFSGWVKQLAVDQTGQDVAAGQKLLSVYSQELYQAEQEYLLAKQSLQSTSDKELRDVQRRLFDASRQRLELLGIPAEERLRLETEGQPSDEPWIRSPVSGTVLEKNVVSGQFIGPGDNLFRLADLSRVWVLADVYERDLASVRVGKRVQMTTSAYPGETFRGKVGFIYPSVAEDTRTLKVRIEFANPDRRLKPGMYAEIDLSEGGDEVLTIPADAIMDEGTRQYAFVMHEGGHFEPRLLELGRRSDDYAEVLSGFTAGEQVVTSANFLIDSESRLKAALAGLGAPSADAHSGHSE